MAGYFPAVPHTAIRNDFCRLYLIIEYRPVLMMYGFEYALLGAHLGAAGDPHVECILGNVDSQYCVDHCPILSSRLCTISALPDMYYRIGTLRFDFVRRAEGMRPTMFAAMNSLTNALVTEDTAAWLGFLDAQDKVRPGGIGCIGYCMSGRYVTTVAARFPNRFAASASLYGVGIVTNAEDSPHLLIDRIKGEMYFGFAETDEHVPANVIPTLKSGLDKAGTRYGLDVFPTAATVFSFRSATSTRPMRQRKAGARSSPCGTAI
jgi:dienelactone hydrolase